MRIASLLLFIPGSKYRTYGVRLDVKLKVKPQEETKKGGVSTRRERKRMRKGAASRFWLAS